MNIDEIKKRILSHVGNDIDTKEGSFANDIISGASEEIARLYDKIDESLNIFFLDNIEGEYALKRCAERNVIQDGGARSSGTLIFSGVDGTVIPKGYRCETGNGIAFETLYESTIADGESEVDGVAVKAGTDGNVKAGEITYLQVYISGITAVTNSEFKGGTEPEKVSDVVERYKYLLKNPPSSGNKSDYIRWATEVDGVADARVVRCPDGPGTVKVILFGADNTAVSELVVSEALAHISEECPLPPEITVVSVEELSITVSGTLTLKTGYVADDICLQAEGLIKKYFSGYDSENEGGKVYVNRIASIIMSIPGVLNVTNVKLNNNTTYITADITKAPKLSEVTLS